MTATPPPPGQPPAPSGRGQYGDAPPPPAPPVPGGGPAGPVVGTAPGGLPHTSGLAIGALICAIASFFVCWIIGAVVALALAYNASNKIDDSGGTIRGSGLATAAKVLGWVHLGLALLIVLVLDLALLNA